MITPKIPMGELKSLYQKSYFKGGVIFFIGGIVANILNYFYRIAMGRILGPELFGELVAIISLILILIVPSTSVQIAAARFSAVFEAKESLKKIRGFFKYLTQTIVLVSLGLIILMVIFASSIQGFLKLSSINYVYFLIGIVVVVLIAGVTKGILQGLKRFSQLSIAMVVESAGKVGLAILLVVLGFKVAGALGGFLIPLILGYFLTIYFLRDILRPKLNYQNSPTPVLGEKTNAKEIKEIWKYIFYSFLSFIFLGILLNIDKILVKHYFLGFDAGIYSAFTTLGQAICVGILLLAGVMFPIVAFKQAKKEDYFHSLKIVSLISFLIVGLVSLIFFLFSKEILLLFFGDKYLAGSSFLGYYGIVMGILGFIFLLSYFFMALDKFKFLYILAIGSVLEILLISIWHGSFLEVISMFSLALIFTLLGLGLLLYRYLWKTKKQLRG